MDPPSKTEFSGGTSSQGSTGYDRTETVVFDGQGGCQRRQQHQQRQRPGELHRHRDSLVLKGTKGHLAFELDFRGDLIPANGRRIAAARDGRPPTSPCPPPR
jgi:hypothetical protein